MLTGGKDEEPMAMTGVVKDELSRLPVLKPCCRKAEVSTLLRFASGLHLVGGRIVKSGGKELALELEARGYEWIEDLAGTGVTA